MMNCWGSSPKAFTAPLPFTAILTNSMRSDAMLSSSWRCGTALPSFLLSRLAALRFFPFSERSNHGVGRATPTGHSFPLLLLFRCCRFHRSEEHTSELQSLAYL